MWRHQEVNEKSVWSALTASLVEKRYIGERPLWHWCTCHSFGYTEWLRLHVTFLKMVLFTHSHSVPLASSVVSQTFALFVSRFAFALSFVVSGFLRVTSVYFRASLSLSLSLSRSRVWLLSQSVVREDVKRVICQFLSKVRWESKWKVWQFTSTSQIFHLTLFTRGGR